MKTWTKLALAIAVLASGTVVSNLRAATTTLQPGPEGKDTFVWSSEDFSHADWGELRVNQITAFDQRVLLEFDLSTIPAGATVTSATLGLYRYGGYNSDGITLDTHQITSPWSESVSSSGQPGYNATAESSTFVTGNGWYTWDLTALTQDWVSGATPNDGVAVYDHGSSYYQRFVSSDNSVATQPSWALPPTDPSLRPYLSITYDAGASVPDASASLTLLSFGVASLAALKRRVKK